MVSAWRKYFAKCKGRVPPAAHGHVEWRGAAWWLPCRCITGIRCGSQCLWGWKVGYKSAYGLCTPFTLFCFPPWKSDKCQSWAKMWRKVDQKKSILSSWRGVRACEGKNNFRSENLTLEHKVCFIPTKVRIFCIMRNKSLQHLENHVLFWSAYWISNIRAYNMIF